MIRDDYTAEKIARLAYRAAQEALRGYKHPKTPNHFTLPQLAACLLLQFSLRMDFREMERWLYENESVCRVMELRSIPHHTTLYRTLKILRIADWERLKYILETLETKEAKERKCTHTYTR